MRIGNTRPQKRGARMTGVFPKAGALVLLLAALGLLSLPGCRNPFGSHEDERARTGTLSLTIGGQGLGRTIMPEIWPEGDIVRFEFEFAAAHLPSNENPPVIVLTRNPGEAWPGVTEVELSAGAWILRATAFVAAGGGESNAVARGSLENIVVLSGENVAGNVELFPIAGAGGLGTFCWHISFPANVARARMEIRQADGTPISSLSSFYLVRNDGGTTYNPHDYDLDAGQYLVVFTLYPELAGYPYYDSAGYERVSAILRIYRNMVSRFTGGDVLPSFDFPRSLLHYVLDAWEWDPLAGTGEWDFAGHEITAGHFALLGVNGINTMNFGAVVGWFNRLVNPGNVPGDLEELKALVDAALIGINMDSIVDIIAGMPPSAGYAAKEDAIRSFLLGIVNHTDPSDPNAVTFFWDGDTVIVTVGHFDVEIDFAEDPDDIIWLAIARGTPTEAIDFIFSASVTGLTESDIQITPPSAVTTGTLTMAIDGRSGVLPISAVAIPGDVSISINMDGIASESQTVAVDGTVVPVTWSAVAYGAPYTTAINFTFTEDVPDLTASHFMVLPGTGLAIRGTSLTGSGLMRTLTVDVVTSGDITVSVIRPGIASESQTVTVTRAPITWNAFARGAPYTTAIDFVFEAPVSGLTVDDIEVTGGVTTGALTGSGTFWSLAVTAVTSPGDITVSINNVSGIVSGSQTVAVTGLITWTATADGTPSTNAIDFVFTAPVMDLTRGQIMVISGIGAVTIGPDVTPVDVYDNGMRWRLPGLTTTMAGDIIVAINRSDVVGTPTLVTVVRPPITWTAAPYPSSPLYTTAIDFQFSEPITGLEAQDIGAFPPTVGTVLRGDVTPLDTYMRQWRLEVTVINPGPVSFRIVRPGISPTWQAVQVIRAPVPWGAEAIGGQYTTAINLIFGDTISELTPAQIVLEHGTPGVVTPGALTGSWPMWTLPVTVTSSGYVRLRINRTDVVDRVEQFDVSAPPALTSVSAGFFHTVAIRADGSRWVWGSGGFGQLGDGMTTTRTSPAQIGADTDWVSVSASMNHNVAIRTDGSLWAWGYGPGVGVTGQQNVPIRIGTDTWRSVSAGHNHTIAIRSDGSLWAWGNNPDGRLGDGTTGNRIEPVRIMEPSTDWVSVSAGYNHTVAIRSDGSLWAWGNNGSSQLGDGTTDNRTSPVRIETDTDWRHVSAGRHRTVAIRNDNSLWVWGDNADGQLGDGTTDNRTSPVRIGTGTSWRYVSTSIGVGPTARGHTIAIATDGSLWAWGVNSFGQLGDGTTDNRTSPVRIGGNSTDWASVSAGDQHSVATRTDDSVWAWGNNVQDQLGNNSPYVNSYHTPQQITLAP